MRLDSDADFEATVTALLNERADRAIVEPDIDAVILGHQDTEPVGGGPTRWWLAVAAVLVVVAGVGAALRDGGAQPDSVGSASEPDRGQVVTTFDVIVWMEVGADSSEVEDIAALLASSSSVEEFIYLNQADTWSEFVEYFADEPEIIELVEPEALPTSFKIRTNAPGAVLELVNGRQGVEEVEEARPDN